MFSQMIIEIVENEMTYNTTLQFGRFAVEDIARFDPVLNHSDSTVEESHQVTTVGYLA